MAEAEDVITDVARHATIFARRLWLRHRHDPNAPEIIQLANVAERIDLLIWAVFGTHYPIRIAQLPAQRTFLAAMFRRGDLPLPATAIPATDDNALWLPADFQSSDFNRSMEQFRTLALQQAMRANRGSAKAANTMASPLERDICLILEAVAGDEALVRMLPGLAEPVHALRRHALARRPRLDSISPGTAHWSCCCAPYCKAAAAPHHRTLHNALRLKHLPLWPSNWPRHSLLLDSHHLNGAPAPFSKTTGPAIFYPRQHQHRPLTSLKRTKISAQKGQRVVQGYRAAPRCVKRQWTKTIGNRAPG